MAIPPYLNPFVLPVATRAAERIGAVDLYLPDAVEPRPAVVFVHGGPVPAGQRPTPREWPIFQAYGSLVASRGFVSVTVDHGLHSLTDYPQAADNVAAAVETARAHPRVDTDRIAIWFFSGGSPLPADWLRTRPTWLRCTAVSYALLAAPPGVDERFQPAAAVAQAGDLPIVLTRAGRDYPMVATSVEAFVAAAEAAGARLEIIDVPNGQHSFDILDHTDESRKAVEQAVEAVLSAVR